MAIGSIDGEWSKSGRGLVQVKEVAATRRWHGLSARQGVGQLTIARRYDVGICAVFSNAADVALIDQPTSDAAAVECARQWSLRTAQLGVL